MMTERLTLKGGPDDANHIKHAAELLRAGGLVAFPTETVYGLAADASNVESLNRLREVKGRENEKPFSLLINSGQKAESISGGLERVAKKFSRLYWPGPLTMVVEQKDSGEQRHIGEMVEGSAGDKRTVGMRVPDHPKIRTLLAESQLPLVASSANRSGGPDPVTASDVLAVMDGEIDLVLDGGPARRGTPSTVAAVLDNQVKVLRHGPVPEDELMEASRPTILFVCTGNTCRSPMAEAIFRKILDRPSPAMVEHLRKISGDAPHCFQPSEWRVCSVGTDVREGQPASPEARNVLREIKVNSLGNHHARSISPPMLDGADWIFTMTSKQRDSILDLFPDASDRVRLLSRRKLEIEDPAPTASEDHYRRVREMIHHALQDLPAQMAETA